ncbi:MAG: acetyl-CoA carboxylase biotin carboxyl carrier protein [Lachnospiraceae bacterium]|nr:acetyl-CoA carboxylase biotin carboxyl carrier protein [Lachnospiraceae bacterium]
MEFENLLKLISAVSDSKLTGLKYEENGVKISMSKNGGKVQTVVLDQEETEHVLETTVQAPSAEKPMQGMIVKAPLVGVFYSAPAEGAAPFVAVGDRVSKGQTLAIIEAMKLMNEIESDYDGTIAEIFVKNEQVVEYGQPLFRIEA